MVDFLSDFMFMLNGPGTPNEKQARVLAAIGEIGDATRSNLFAADCLVTWAKTMGFLEDTKFVAAVNASMTGDSFNDRSMRGTVWRSHIMCWAARQGLSVAGDFVEAGCYAGDTALVIMRYTDFAQTGRAYWLYDLFDNDGKFTQFIPQHTGGLYERTVARFAGDPSVHIIKGRLPDSFSDGMPEAVALLHIDLNNAPSERAVLEQLWDRMSPGGVIVFDDYGWVQYRQQKLAADAFMAERGRMIMELPTGQGLAIR